MQSELTPELTPELMPEQVYGLKDGAYMTPYQTTVIYNPKSAFESAVALLTDRAQLVPRPAGLETCEHPSPVLIVFGSEFDVQDACRRGFQSILVFLRDPSDRTIQDDCSEGKKISIFGAEDVLDHVELVAGLIPIYVIEHMVAAEFPDRKGNVSHDEGLAFLRGVNHSNRGLAEIIVDMCSGIDGFEKLTKLVMSGSILRELDSAAGPTGIMYELRAPHEGGVYKICAFNCEKAPNVVPAEADFALTYQVDKINGEVVWFITLTGANAFEVLDNFGKAASCGDSAAAYISLEQAASLLTFIY